MKRIFCERKPQRRTTRPAQDDVASALPRAIPAGNNDDLDDLLANIDALLAQCAA